MIKYTIYFLLMALAMMVACQSKTVTADMIISGGNIYTMDDANPVAEAVAVSGDTIVFVGTLSDAKKLQSDKTEWIDLKGATLTPGFIETHGHIMGLGYSELRLDLTTIRSYDEMVEKVKDAVSRARPGQWILGWGWHQEKWDVKPDPMVKGFQTHQKLSKVSPDNPVFLVHVSGHLAFANENAMKIAGVNQLSVEKLRTNVNEGGEVILDNLGNPTGIFNESAQSLIAEYIPENTPESDADALSLALKACAKNGITGFHDAGASREGIELFMKFRDENKLSTRLYVMVTGRDLPLVREWLKRGPVIDPKGVTVRSVKLNCDGALGSRGAWLTEAYSDRPGFFGMPTFPMDTVLTIAREGLRSGFQICAHAIGDRANHEILDRYETAFKEFPDKTDNRFRIEHAQHLLPSDIPRFARLGVIPAMQAIHLSSDRPWAIKRLGEKRIKEGAYMWQSLLRTGAKVINGTDVPIEPINPIASFYASVTRMTLRGEPAGGYEPEEKMTREQALRAYTLDAAFGAFEEKIKGSIVVGKLADFTVFTKDIMKVPDGELLSTEIAMTVVGGRKVFVRE